ncbi:type VI secretion system Vgr family protein [Polyangium aurulentum]|uniref:type VI secretion system Vgr family protein n=1 Tax=Polyangium aurulentum TaxID=2567896 RepID=UPI0010ADD7A9|nr:type VI secretion system tip protein TssI/VgrG [Polyangium aurulentum]UQA57877.1 type VI secretion system tip protein VgrG [Polyangium aurulentum]
MLHLSFESGEDSLAVHRFSVREALSSLFEVSIEARSPSEDIDLGAIIGRAASFRLVAGAKPAQRNERLWTGVCSHIEQTHVEPTGLSTYHMRIVPRLWLLTQRRNHRAFQHLSIPEIAERLLAEWRIEPRWRIDRAAHPKLELRTQYGESDYAFLCRLLEEAGMSFYFEEEGGEATRLVLHDHPHGAEPHLGGPVPYTDKPEQAAGHAYVTRLRLAHDVQPGRVAIRDVDFRRNTEFQLIAQASSGDPVNDPLEQFHYAPGAFLVEGVNHGGAGTPVADDKGVARHDERAGKLLAERTLEAARAATRVISFETNLVELAPGVVFTVGQHPRADLGPEKKLLMAELSIEGAPSTEWKLKGRALFADVPYRPARRTPKPQIHSVESAIVVGPKGEEIHTDEFGRVRVQFHWDREGQFDDGSSCWIRVSQGWAGSGYGMLALPRIGQEVLVGFFGGDPDQPVIVGRLFNQTAPVPQRLPERSTASTWRSMSTPGGQGWNEITFEDQAGSEQLYVQAQRDYEKLVKANENVVVGGERSRKVGGSENIVVGGERSRKVGGSERVTIGDDQHIHVASHRNVVVGGDEQVRVTGTYAVNAGPPEAATPAGLEIADRKITLTTGEATITLEGPNITLEAAASILLGAAADITIRGKANIYVVGGANVTVKSRAGDLVLDGGPHMFLNPTANADIDPSIMPVEAPLDLDMRQELVEAEDLCMFDPSEPEWVSQNLAEGGAWDPNRWGPDHEEFGFFHLGVTAAAAGIPLGVVLRQMGKKNLTQKGPSAERGDPGNGLFGGVPPYGNEPEQYDLIVRGARYHRANAGAK